MNPTLSRSIDMDIPEGDDEEGSGREKITNHWRRRKAFSVQRCRRSRTVKVTLVHLNARTFSSLPTTSPKFSVLSSLYATRDFQFLARPALISTNGLGLDESTAGRAPTVFAPTVAEELAYLRSVPPRTTSRVSSPEDYAKPLHFHVPRGSSLLLSLRSTANPAGDSSNP